MVQRIFVLVERSGDGRTCHVIFNTLRIKEIILVVS